jgi:hypothetical protein
MGSEGVRMLEIVQKLFRGLNLMKKSGPGAENRRQVRVSVDFTVRCVDEHDTITDARVVDLAISGMGLVCDTQLTSGTELRVQLLEPVLLNQNDLVFCTVRWCRPHPDGVRFEAGLLFMKSAARTEKTWSKYLLREMGFDEKALFTRRKQLRTGVAIPAEVLLGRAPSIHGTVLNLGAGGCLLSIPVPLEMYEPYDLCLGPTEDFPMLYLRANVKLVKSEQGLSSIGLQFQDLSDEQTKLLGDYVLNLLKNNEPVHPV